MRNMFARGRDIPLAAIDTVVGPSLPAGPRRRRQYICPAIGRSLRRPCAR